jgi:ATP-dependent RNA helicase DbpA
MVSLPEDFTKLNFESLPLRSELRLGIEQAGFKQMTPIQSQSLPLLLKGLDVTGQSPTGSGKTLAFTLPILNKIDLEKKQVQALVIGPTRELISQVVVEIRKMGRELPGLQVLSLVGGESGRDQAQTLRGGVHVVVGTPGRILDQLERGKLDLASLEVVVLDEADKMLEMGFQVEIRSVMAQLPRERQTVLFSATLNEATLDLSRRYLKNPVKIDLAEDEITKPQIQQFLYESIESEKINNLMRVMQQHPANLSVIFCNRKATVIQVGELLTQHQVSHVLLHGDLEQRERERALAIFRNGSARILVATDVAGRGLDIENLELVVNLDLPAEPQVYLHRVGRVGRAGRVGTAVTLVPPNEEMKMLEIENLVGQKIEKKILGFKNQHGLGGFYRQALMQTLAISGGRKDKLRAGDILGALTAGADLKAEDVGKIEVQDKISFVAVKSEVAKRALDKLRDGKVKGSKYQVRWVK